MSGVEQNNTLALQDTKGTAEQREACDPVCLVLRGRGEGARYAFTLAEILITLGIIGIVAAMTMPALINKTKDKQFKVAYKKAYSSVSQAFLRMQADGVYKNPFDDMRQSTNPETGVVTYYSPAIGKNFKTISKYFKVTKTCFDNNADDCWECDNGQAGHGSASEWLGCNRASYAFVDGSGMGWYMYNNSEYPIIVDVNGKKKPNRLGQDRFVLKFASNSDRNSAYVEEADSIMPWGDYTGDKQRWCPSGNCLYKTWLIN